MIRIQQLKLNEAHTGNELEREILRILKIKKEEMISYEIIKRSIDARKKPVLKFVYTIDVKTTNETKILKKAKNAAIQTAEKRTYQSPVRGEAKLNKRPVIVGCGPAGLFCALLLAREGYRPIILERGETAVVRQEKITKFWQTGILDERANIQFGEGGAGTFSDGKLNTAVKDPKGRGWYIMEGFVHAGAPEEILWTNKPHIGTDILRTVVANIRKEICSLGGEVRFLSQVTDILTRQDQVCAVEINHKEIVECQVLIFAIGHSARDTFRLLAEKSVVMRPKPFAVGVRIEHPQEMIDLSQYGKVRTDKLPAAEYKLTRKMANGRGVYSFCMCPGGYVVNASSEEGRTAVNGMSYHSRSGKNANSAMVVTVTPEDFAGNGILAGVEFQGKLEELAFAEGDGGIPVQLLGDFCNGQRSREFGDITPSIKGLYQFGNLHQCFPETVYQSLKLGILECGGIITGFDRTDAVLSGVESRTSSPVRIERNDVFESNISGLYPCGEGAGYAGGITSAAMDGLKVAEAVIKKYLPSE